VFETRRFLEAVMNQRAVAVAILAASVGLPFAALVYFYWRDWPYAVAVLVGALIALRGRLLRFGRS
jgi:hypothetical protein